MLKKFCIKWKKLISIIIEVCLDWNWLIYCYIEVNLVFININKILILNFNSWDLFEIVWFEGGLGISVVICRNILIVYVILKLC